MSDSAALVATQKTERHRFTVEDFLRMAEAGIFTEDDRVELLDGDIVQMAPIGSRHASVVIRLNRLLGQQIGETYFVSPQNPVRLTAHSLPQPDLAILRPRADFYAKAHPTPDDVLLLIEVADTTLREDRKDKIPSYARAGIPEVWLVDLVSEVIERYTAPRGGFYREAQIFSRGETVEGQIVSLAVDDILG